MATLKGEAEERLLVEAAQKNPARFDKLYERNFERVYAFLARRVHDQATAEDLTSEVFHRALASLPRFEWRDVPFAVWLLRIARNALADHWQRTARDQGNPQPEPAEDADLEAAERRTTLFRLVTDLPADQRRVIVERFAEQHSIREIAKQLGRSEGAVKQLQFRALKTLRARLGESDG